MSTTIYPLLKHLKPRLLSKKGRILAGVVIVLLLLLAWLATTGQILIWSTRNVLQYHLLTSWWGIVGEPQPPGATPGTLAGTVYDSQNQPLEGAWVLVSRWDGTTYRTQSDAAGHYSITNIPPGSYHPVAGAAGYENVQFGNLFDRVSIQSATTTRADVVLPAEQVRIVSPGRDLKLGEPATRTCTHPFNAQAIRRQIYFQSGDELNQPSFYYTPITTTAAAPQPILLAIYPGPADSWECASIPLAADGYMILATGPAYSFDLEKDVDELERLLAFARAGVFSEGDGSRIALLAGSYSSLHVQRLLQRRSPVKAALLLGPPTDLFDMRRRLEEGSYIPPFGLDQALRALGFPDRAPLLYFTYSGAYHLRPDFPPLAILHSRTDEVVPYQQSELLAANLAQTGAPFETYFFDGASHYLLAEGADDDTRLIFDLALTFLAGHLK